VTQLVHGQIQAALDLHQRGELSAAEKIYLEVLERDEKCFDALQLLGAIAAATRRPELALVYIDRALAIKADNARVFFNRASVLRDLNRLEEALTCYDCATAIEPGCADAYNSRGNVLLKLHRPEMALASFDQAIALKSDFASAHSHRGLVLHELGFLDTALASYDLAISLRPDDAKAHLNRGNVLTAMKRFDEALASYDRALAHKPDFAEAHNNRGNPLIELNRIEDALVSYDRAVAINPTYAEAHNNRGLALMELDRLDDALTAFDTAIAIKPDYVGALGDRGLVLQKLGGLDEALSSYDFAIYLRPDDTQNHLNRGNVLTAMRRLDEALTSYDRALSLSPDSAEAHSNAGLLRLLMGDFDTGWQGYEWRWQVKKQADQPRAYHQPLWLGEADLRGKRILLWSEQGFGDAIQFSRYVSKVAALGATVILEAPATLAPLLTTLDGVAEFVAKGGALPPFDFHCPLLSLPLALRTSLGKLTGEPYLAPPPERVADWVRTLGNSIHARVGLAWSGSTTHSNDRNRSIPLSRFSQALPNGIEYIQLQKGVRTDDQVWLTQHPVIRSFESQINDFGDTAALIKSLDLVITVDTSVAHLAGALGKDVWILLPHVPDWRWLLDRTDSPWYDSATLFRQPAPGDWDSVLVAVRQALAQRFGKLPFRASRHQ
jgi:tetratricopeptide (TPR) repeat protein